MNCFFFIFLTSCCLASTALGETKVVPSAAASTTESATKKFDYDPTFWTNKEGAIMNAILVSVNRSGEVIQSVIFDIKGNKLTAAWDDLSPESQQQAIQIESERAQAALLAWQNKNNPQKQIDEEIQKIDEPLVEDKKSSIFTSLTGKVKNLFTKEEKPKAKEKQSGLLDSANDLIAKAKDSVANLNTQKAQSSSYIKSINYDMLRLQKGIIKASPNTSTPKYIAIYYSAHWCPPCRAFTPKLVNFYNKNKGENFELIFVSSDENQSTMNKYITGDKMPWLVLPYNKVKTSPMWTKFAGRGIPCLVVINSKGKVLLDSYKGSSYIGPHQVMNDLQKLISQDA